MSENPTDGICDEDLSKIGELAVETAKELGLDQAPAKVKHKLRAMAYAAFRIGYARNTMDGLDRS